VYLLVLHAYINEMHGSRSKIPSKKSRLYIYIYDVKFLALLGAPYIYIYIHDISKLRVNVQQPFTELWCLWDNAKTYGRARQPTGYNMVQHFAC
jgi:hypothetical protein